MIKLSIPSQNHKPNLNPIQTQQTIKIQHPCLNLQSQKTALKILKRKLLQNQQTQKVTKSRAHKKKTMNKIKTLLKQS